MKITDVLKRMVMVLIICFGVNVLNNVAHAGEKFYGDTGIPADYTKTLLDMKKISRYQASMAALPGSYNLKELGKVTPAKNQGGCGSCWAFASVGVLESHLLIVTDGSYDLSEQQQVSCNTAMNGCSGGNSNALRFWETIDPMKESCTGYCACDTKSCSSISGCNTVDYNTVGYYTVNTGSVEDMKTSIYNDGAGYFRFTVYSDFNTFWDSAKAGTVYTQKDGGIEGGHAVLLIGWDDMKNAWLCKNSWGEKAGPNGDGTFWIAYNGHANDLNFGLANLSSIEMREVQKIACVDNAGFNMSFKIGYMDSTGAAKESSSGSSNYPIDQWKTINLSGFDSNIPEGTVVWPRVHASGGDTNNGDMRFRYRNNNQVASYMAHGTTKNYSVAESGSPVVNPASSSASKVSTISRGSSSKKNTSGTLKEVQKISCSNDAAFVMYFKVGYTDSEGKDKESSTSSSNYPINQWKTIDLSNLDPALAEGTTVWVRVHAKGGKTKNGDTKLIYRKNNQVASYVVKGATLTYSVKDTEN